MKLQHVDIRGEVTPAIVLPCLSCGDQIVVGLPDVRTTSPVACSSCRSERRFSYREYVDIVDRYSPVLLEFSIRRMRSSAR